MIPDVNPCSSRNLLLNSTFVCVVVIWLDFQGGEASVAAFLGDPEKNFLNISHFAIRRRRLTNLSLGTLITRNKR